MFVVILRYLVSPETMDLHRPAHWEWLDRYYAKGVLIASGPQIPKTGGCILARGVTRRELEDILREDPFSLHHLAEYQIFEVDVTKAAPDFVGLLNKMS